MNIFSKVTWKTMKKNRVRTLVTIVGVILSTAMFTAVTTFCSSLMEFSRRTCIYREGNWHILVQDADSLLYAQMARDKDTVMLGSAGQLGYAAVETENDQKPYLYILEADAVFLEQMPVHIIKGRLPEEDTEILLPYHLYANGGFSAELGDVLELSVGERRMEEEKLGQGTGYIDGEILTLQTEKTYTVVGFYERPSYSLEGYSAPGYTALTYSDKGVQAEKEYFLSVLLRRPGKTIDDYDERNGLREASGAVKLNWDVLMFSGVWRYNNIMPFVGGMAVVLSILILMGSVSLIYSAFSISVSERTKQFGLLSSVGATRRQIRRCVFSEAGIVSVIGIPLGLLSGVAGMGVTLALVGDLFRHIIDSPYAMRLSVSAPALLAAALIALFTVFLSVWIPAKRATKVTAIEAIRQGKEITVRGKTVKTSKLVYALFGLEGALAQKYFKRSKRKYRTTVISLTLSIVLFVSSSVFGRELFDTVSTGLSPSKIDVLYYMPGEMEIEELTQWFSSIEGVKEMTHNTIRTGYMILEEDKQTGEYKEYLEKSKSTGPSGWTEEKTEETQTIGIYYLAEELYRRLAVECGISAAEYESENPPAVVLNRRALTLYIYNKANEMERITYELPILKPEVSEITCRGIETAGEEALEPYSVRIGGKIEEIPSGIYVYTYSYEGILLFYPERARVPKEEDHTIFCFKASDYETMIQGLKQVLKENTLTNGDYNIVDFVEQEKEKRDMVVLANVFSYGFITLISLIAVANVFHTISTNIALRRRDFAMLRSVGMTAKGLFRMMFYECLLYGSRALLFGLPLSLCMALLIHRVTSNAVISGFTVPWAAMGIASFSVFVVVFATMLYAVNKIKQDNLMDDLKNENI
ncbi:MAG: ABC transporter permease [Lachnospiraceae bacterium]|nr:ABC transporter permease [Lachnospiraceae bacterium]